MSFFLCWHPLLRYTCKFRPAEGIYERLHTIHVDRPLGRSNCHGGAGWGTHSADRPVLCSDWDKKFGSGSEQKNPTKYQRNARPHSLYDKGGQDCRNKKLCPFFFEELCHLCLSHVLKPHCNAYNVFREKRILLSYLCPNRL